MLRKNLSPVDQESSTSEYSNEVVEQGAENKKEGEFTEMDSGTIVNEQVSEEENASPASDETPIPRTDVVILAKQQLPNKAKVSTFSTSYSVVSESLQIRPLMTPL